MIDVPTAIWVLEDFAIRTIGYAGPDLEVTAPSIMTEDRSDFTFDLALQGVETDVVNAIYKVREVWDADASQPIRMPAAAAVALSQWMQVLVLAGQVEAIHERQAKALGNGKKMSLERAAYEELFTMANPRRLTLALKDLSELQTRATRLLRSSPDHPKHKKHRHADVIDAQTS